MSEGAAREPAGAGVVERPPAAPTQPRRPRRGSTARSKMRRGYADKMLRPAEDKSQDWDLYGSAPA
jgi:hypothetical protein